MGVSHGKLVLKQQTSEAVKANATEGNSTDADVSVQPKPLENGHADPVEQVQNSQQKLDVNNTGEQANGDVVTENHEDDSVKKLGKKQNPITWLKRKISKRSVSTNKKSVDQNVTDVEASEKPTVESDPAQAEPEQKTTDECLDVVAEDLVQHAIDTAASNHLAESACTPDASLSVVANTPLESPTVEHQTQQAESCPTEVPEDIPNHFPEMTNDQLSEPVIDTNNTNVYNEDALPSKLANTDLVNGHHEMPIVINGTANTDDSDLDHNC